MVFGVIAPGVAAVLVVLLAVQNRRLETELASLRSQLHLPQVGDVLPSVRVPRLDGDSLTLGAGSGRVQVLFIFNTRCAYCVRTLPTWKALATRLGAVGEVEIYGVSLDSDSATAAYAMAHEWTVPLVRFPSADAAAVFRAVGVPLTLALDRTGRVLYRQAGVVTDAAAELLVDVVAAQNTDTLGT
jgi:peroxiredoxin